MFIALMGYVPVVALDKMYSMYILRVKTEFFSPGSVVLINTLFAPLEGVAVMILPLLASSALNDGLKGTSKFIGRRSVLFGFVSAALVHVWPHDPPGSTTSHPVAIIFVIIALFASALFMFARRAEVNLLEREHGKEGVTSEEAQQTISADRREDAAPAER